MVATERDFAVSQMKDMAEQMQTVAEEFKSMADHCDQLLKELEQVENNRLCYNGKTHLHREGVLFWTLFFIVYIRGAFRLSFVERLVLSFIRAFTIDFL